MGWENSDGEVDIALSIYDIAKEFNVRVENVEAIADGKPTPDALDPKTIVKIKKRLQAAHLIEEPIIPPGFEPLPKMRKVPVIGEIACGEPITAEQNIEGYVDAPMDVHADFVLICKGDSMIDAGIRNGDAVFIRIQETVENGEIAAVRIDDEATLKRVYWDGDTLVLMPANNAYAPKSFRGEEINDVHIEGKAIGYMHWF